MSEIISGKYSGSNMIIYLETVLGIILAGLSCIFNNLCTCWGCYCGYYCDFHLSGVLGLRVPSQIVPCMEARTKSPPVRTRTKSPPVRLSPAF